jgi:hypothetical protein
LACIAGFYGELAHVREAARQLQADLGLQPSQMVMLSPRDAGSTQFALKSRRWSGGWRARAQAGSVSPGAVVALAGLLMLSIGVGGWVLAAEASDGLLLLGISLAVVCGGLAAGLAVSFWTGPPRRRRFETSVQQQLAEGCWAVVVHGVAGPRQAAVVDLLRGGSLRWCAVVAPAARL